MDRMIRLARPETEIFVSNAISRVHFSWELMLRRKFLDDKSIDVVVSPKRLPDMRSGTHVLFVIERGSKGNYIRTRITELSVAYDDSIKRKAEEKLNEIYACGWFNKRTLLKTENIVLPFRETRPPSRIRKEAFS